MTGELSPEAIIVAHRPWLQQGHRKDRFPLESEGTFKEFGIATGSGDASAVIVVFRPVLRRFLAE
jgi:hypothetical protein